MFFLSVQFMKILVELKAKEKLVAIFHKSDVAKLRQDPNLFQTAHMPMPSLKILTTP